MNNLIEKLENETDFFSSTPMGTLQKMYYCDGVKAALELVKADNNVSIEKIKKEADIFDIQEPEFLRKTYFRKGIEKAIEIINESRGN